MSEKNEKELKIVKQMIKVCKRLHKKNMLAAADGNISYRISDDLILITPSGVAKSQVEPKEIAAVKLSGEVLYGNPSSEMKMHLEVYRTVAQAKSVVHAHPPHAIAWSVAFPNLKELPSTSLSEVILAAGRIPFVDYARPGTSAMGENLKTYLPECRLMILSRHGALSWGEDLEEAYIGMERIEHSAQILHLAQSLGQLTELPKDEVDALVELKKKIGPRTL